MPVAAFDSGFSPGFGANRKGFLRVATKNYPGTGNYEDGDIIAAVNWRRQRHQFAEQAVFKRAADGKRFERLNGIGFFDIGDAAEDYLAACCEFKFERLDKNRVRKTRISDGQFITIEDGVPFTDLDGKTNRIFHVDEYFARRAKSLRSANSGQGRPLFGAHIHNVVMYGGQQNMSHTVLDTVWTAIETKLGVLESSIPDEIPFTRSTYRTSLVVAVDDFDDQTSGDLTSPLVDETDPENPVTVKKRKNKIIWRDLPDVVEADVLDPSKEIRVDKIRKHVRNRVVQTKVLP